MHNGTSIEHLIRIADIHDLSAILDIETLCFTKVDQFAKRRWTYLLSKAKCTCLVMESQGKVIAYACLLIREKIRNIRIYSIAVLPEVKGHHLGQKLIERCIQLAQEEGFKELTLEVRFNNYPALHLYQKMGFIYNWDLPGYYGDGTNGFRMKLEI